MIPEVGLITYQNRMEGDYLTPLASALIVWILVFVCLYVIFRRHMEKWKGKDGGNKMLMIGFAILATGCAANVFVYLFI